MTTKPPFLVRVFVLMLSAGTPVVVHAQHMNEKDSPCADVVVASDQVSCLSKAKDAADEKLTDLYKKLWKKLQGEDADHLVDTQKTWMKYREQNCSAERALYGESSNDHPVYIACLEAMTRVRIKELQITYAVRLKD